MMVAERGASENTVSAYRGDLEEFSLFLHRRGRRIEGSDTENIREYLSQLRQTKKSISTQSRRLSVLRQFYSFLPRRLSVLMTLPSVSTDLAWSVAAEISR